MMEPRLELELAGLAERVRRVHLNLGLSLCWFSAAAIAIISAVLGSTVGWNGRLPTVTAVAASLIAAVVVYVITRNRAHNLIDAARQIERRFPSLDHRLLAAIEQPAKRNQLGYLQHLVVREAVEHSMRYNWRETIPSSRVTRARLVQAFTLVLMWTGLVFAWQSAPGGVLNRASGNSGRPGLSYRVTVEPGDTSIERGTDLLVLARFSGPLPADVHVVCESEVATPHRVALAKSMNDPLFGGRVSAVATDLTYHVEFDGERSPDYHLTVFDYPAVNQLDAELTYPAYTGLATRRIEDTRHISAVQGTTVTLIAQLNKQVARAWLSDDSGQRLDMSLPSSPVAECRVTIQLNWSQRFALHLLDSEGRANKFPPEITLTAIPDRPPELVLKAPARDVHASPLEELWLEAQAWDDFGITSYGVTITHGTKPPRSITLGQNVAGSDKRQIEYTLFLENEQALPDELFSYYFWADDTGPDSKPRRTWSDMFFVEVRPFEEVYRQGQQPTDSETRRQAGQQNGGGAGQQAAQLAELQKQIINATWKLIRQSDAKPADRAKDIGVVRDSQIAARGQLQQLSEQAVAPDAAETIDDIERHMTAAVEELEAAVKQTIGDPLQWALSSEKAAYQSLLKLRAREHNVIRGRQMAQNGASQGNRADRQLAELELDNRENRYETRRAPNSAQQQAAREDNQVLNRLRELARRQEDLNKRMQELQSALQAARDEAERKELQRQLERLRDEQQDMMRDLDELRDRMERPENQQRMAESREQLEQTRQNMRQASDSLRQERLAPALNSGTRAERELQQARDDFRRRTANQFADDMRTMRDDARKLAQRERELGDRLDQINNAPRQSLRDDERGKVTEAIDEQRSRLNDLTNDMKTVSEAAEASEPLLSKQLYDTFRDTTQRNVDRSMELTSQLLRRGFVPEASKAEQNVRQDVERVRAGVERAARSILGDPAEATRRALEEVEDLSRQLQQEITRADPDGAPSNDGQQQLAGEPSQQQNNTAPNGPATKRGQPDPQQEQRQQGRASAQSSQAQQASDSSEPAQSQSNQTGRTQKAGRGAQADARDAQNAPSNANRTAANSNAAERRTNSSRSGQPNPGTRSGSDGNVDIAGWTGPGGPITGDEFRQWSDRLRDVEEMLENPNLRAEVAEINDRARDVRRDLKRHSKEPNWSSVQLLIAQPLVELQTKLREELARQEASDPLAPIDRDPVPRKYTSSVQEYYERLGSGK
jgi:hypothetical protein